MSYGTYLTRSRHRTNWYARIVVPNDVRLHFRQRREIRKTLGTPCKSTARRRALAVWLAYQDVFEALRNRQPVNNLNPDWGALAGITTAIQSPKATPRLHKNPDLTITHIEPLKARRASTGETLAVEFVTINPVTSEITVTDATDDDIRLVKELMTHRWQWQHEMPAMPPPSEIQADSPPLSKLFEEFAAERLKDSREKTEESMRYALMVFIELIGDIPANQLSKDHAREFARKYADYPVQRSKGRWANMSPEEVRAAGKSAISAVTFNNNVGRLRMFGSWLAELDLLPANPFEVIQKAKTPQGPPKDRSWSEAELRKWHHSDYYLKHRLSDTQAWKYWLPMLALYTGARLEELSALAPDDVGVFDGILAFRIHAEDGRHVKNSSSWRYVPVHSHLEQLGFMDLVKSRRGHERLFTLQPFRNEYGKRASKAFTSIRKKLALEPTFHGYRNTVIAKLSDEVATLQHISWLVGHAVPGQTARYEAARDPLKRLKTTKELVDRLDWSHVIDIPA